MNWISEFVDLENEDKLDLIKRFSLSTAEVENEIYFKGQDIENVVFGKIVSVSEHPESKKLHLLKVDIGSGEELDIVCGAPNVCQGMITAVAKIGGKVGGIDIEPRSVGGVMSYGMCCSEAELGIGDDNSGIMNIKDDVVLGVSIKEVYQIDDIVFEVDNKSLTNRPDLWGHYGMAREFSVLAKKPLKDINIEDLDKYNDLPELNVEVLDKDCLRYSCLKISNIMKSTSPVNIKIRLHYCGLRAINLLADLTNYIMLELGQPMHAFDARKVDDIKVKKFAENFKFVTLDGVEREIDPNTLMICNNEQPVAVAGVMGGLDSEILDDTTELVLESAAFDAASIRKSAVRLANRTDASARYEKSLDPELCQLAVARFVMILQNIDHNAKIVSKYTDKYLYHFPEISILFDKKYVDMYTGIDISNDNIKETLTALGFGVTERGDGSYKVQVPSWRRTKDVSIKADIIEEITRIYGYDNFDVYTAKSPLYPIRVAEEKNIEDKIKDILVKKYCMNELHSYIWMYYDDYRALGIEVEENVKLQNATSPNIETIRNSIVPTQLCQVKNNVSYDSEFSIFEIGRIIDGYKADGMCNEKKKLTFTLFSKEKTITELYYNAMDIIGDIIMQLRHDKVIYKPLEVSHSYQHPKNLNSVVCQDTVIGEIGTIHPVVLEKIDKKANIVYVELDVKDITNLDNLGIHYVEPSKYPSIEVDLSFVADKFDKIRCVLENEGTELLKSMQVIDEYDDGVQKSITTKLEFNSKERTLTRDEVMEVVNAIIKKLNAQGIVLKA